jgi:imidazolonepropionase
VGKKKVDLLILGSSETVTMNRRSPSDDLGVIDDGGIAVDSGKIVLAASSQLLERKYVGRRRVYVDDELLLPGFVDPHTHLVFDGSRELEFQLRIDGTPYMEILKRHGGILETVNRTRQATVIELVSKGRKRLDTALEAGTTTIEVKSGYGLRPYDEMKILQVIDTLRRTNSCRIVPTFMGAHAVPQDVDSESYSRLVVEEMLPEVRKSRLASFCDVFCEQGVFDEIQSRRILRTAKHMGLEAKIHADEFSDSQGAKVANDLSSTSADHLVHTPSRELERMAKNSTTPVLLPASSQSLLAHEYASAREMLEMGLSVALGTDFSPANWTLSQLTVATAAARELRMKSDEILRGITINAAGAVGMENQVGSLTMGKKADIVALRVPNHKWVGYADSEGLVDKVFIGGQLAVENGKRVG